MITIYSIQFNRPDFIHLQNKTLKHFLKDDFELVVINNSNNELISQSISEMCRNESLSEVRISSNISANAASAYPGYHHSIAMNEVLKNEISKNTNTCVILDGDVFLMGEYSFEERMKGAHMFGAYQQRKGRYWLTPVVIGLKPAELPDFDSINLIGSHIFNQTPNDVSKDMSFFPRKIGENYVFDCPVCTGLVNDDSEKHIPLDTGGELYMYLKAHPEVKVKKAPATSHLKGESIESLPQEFRHRYSEEYFFEFYDSKFLHYCRSSNWDHKTHDYHVSKTGLLNDMIDEAILGHVTFNAEYKMPDNDWCGWPQVAINNHGDSNEFDV